MIDSIAGLDELEHILAELPKDAEVEVRGLHYVTSNSSALNYLQAVENAAWDVEKHFVLAVDVKLAKRLVELSYRKKRAYFHFIVPRFVSVQLSSETPCCAVPAVPLFLRLDGPLSDDQRGKNFSGEAATAGNLIIRFFAFFFQTVKQFWTDVRMFDQSTVASFQIIDEIEFKNMKSMRGGVSTPKNPEDEHVNVSI